MLSSNKCGFAVYLAYAAGSNNIKMFTLLCLCGVPAVLNPCFLAVCLLLLLLLAADNIKMFTLDEADEMLSRGFKDQIYDIFQLLPPKLQVRHRDSRLHGA